ncbi:MULTISPECIES: hypothetical protein [unclassified Clostridium]|uniref:hypothetical protein n=1 Tax=unclassified Clostridium TaxID=2614128 RepID=UPI0025C0980A|nr:MULTISPECIES: hypothetical protein [unclassified Clostridium]
MDRPIDIKILEYKKNIVNAINNKNYDLPITVKQMILNEIKVNLDNVVVQVIQEELNEIKKNEEKSEDKIDE